jgi:hypothetical protein
MYTKEIELNHNEVAAKINKETGEIHTYNTKAPNNPDFVYIKSEAPWNKTIKTGWIYLEKVLSATEYKVAHQLYMLAANYTCSLMPYNDNTTYSQLAKDFNLDDKTIKKVMNKLFDEGVYGKWEVTNADYKHTKYWCFNPYLGYNGKGVHYLTKSLFDNTMIARLVISYNKV